jgi:hypothetical protein
MSYPAVLTRFPPSKVAHQSFMHHQRKESRGLCSINRAGPLAEFFWFFIRAHSRQDYIGQAVFLSVSSSVNPQPFPTPIIEIVEQFVTDIPIQPRRSFCSTAAVKMKFLAVASVVIAASVAQIVTGGSSFSVSQCFIALTADVVSYDPGYDLASRSLGEISCSDGENGLITKHGWTVQGNITSFPSIGGAFTIAGWNSLQVCVCSSLSNASSH